MYFLEVLPIILSLFSDNIPRSLDLASKMSNKPPCPVFLAVFVSNYWTQKPVTVMDSRAVT